VASQYWKVKPGQLFVILPEAVLYQLSQPVTHTVDCIRSWTSRVAAAIAAGATSSQAARRDASSARQRVTQRTWHSSMKMIELCPRFVFGP